MKGRGGEDGVDRVVGADHGRAEVEEITLYEAQTLRGGGETSTRLLEHRGRPVKGDDAPVGEAVEELSRDAPAAAAGVKDSLRAGELEATEDLATPPRLRIGNLVVLRPVPVT